MPHREPEPADSARRRTPLRASLRRNLAPAGAIGVLMGLVAAKEGSGVAVAVVVAVVGCAIVLAMLAVKR